MKNIISYKSCLAVSLFAVSTASSASVWMPNDGDINFLSFSTSSHPFPSFSETFGIFEDTADVSAAAPVATFNGIGAVSFTQNGSNYDISSGLTSGTLLGSNNFQLGYLSGGVWSTEAGNVDLAPDSNLLVFSDSQAFNNLHFLYAFDISPSQAAEDNPISAVPLPAAVWLMTSALLGFLFTERRKSIQYA